MEISSEGCLTVTAGGDTQTVPPEQLVLLTLAKRGTHDSDDPMRELPDHE